MSERPLLVDLSEELPREHPLRDVTVIGRSADCDVQLDDPMVAARHAEVRLEGGRWFVVDLGSRTGTYLRGAKVTRAELADGDELLVGPARLRFGTASSTDRRPSRPPPGLALTPFQRRATRSAHATLPDHAEDIDPEALRREFGRLRTGLVLARELALEHDAHRVLERVAEALLSALSADRALATTLDEDLRPKDSVARARGGGDGGEPHVIVSTTMMSEALGSRQGVLFAGAAVDDKLGRARSISAQNIVSAICVPMIVKDRIVGLVHADARGGAERFTTEDLEIASVIAAQAAIAVENAALVVRVEQSTRLEAERMRRVLDALPDGVIVLDPAHRVVVTNERATQLLAGLAVHDADGALTHIGAAPVARAVASPGQPFEIGEAGATGRALVVSARTDASAGVAGAVVLVLRDVTFERERDAVAGRTERLALVGRLASGIAHDFNNVLGAVLNYATFIVDESSEAQVREDASEIVNAAQRAADLTAQLLSFGRRDVVRAGVTDIAPIVRGVARLVGGPGVSRIAVTAELPSVPMLVVIDPSKLERVLMNLTVNARDATPEGGKIVLRCAPLRLDDARAQLSGVTPGHWIAIDVIDHGSGMPREVAARAFEPFFTTKEPGRGTGLGLATSYGIVQQAGGNILLDSTPGAGTTVRVLLPEGRTAAVSTPPRGLPAARPARTGAVLVVDDDETNRRVIRRLLADAGHTVVLATGATDALRIAGSAEAFDVILTDLTTRGLSGKDLVSRVLAARPDVVPAFMSAHYDAATARGSVLDEDAIFLAKPFRRSELLMAVSEALHRRDPHPAR